MGERLLCKQEVIGSIPFTSTSFRRPIRAGHLAPTGHAGTSFGAALPIGRGAGGIAGDGKSGRSGCLTL